MEVSEIKSLINTYYKAGQPKDITAELVSKLGLNGSLEETLEYIHKIYSNELWNYARNLSDQVMVLAKEVVKSLYKEASLEKNDDRREEIAKFAHISESESKRHAMIELAQSEPGIPIEVKDVDANHWYFNCLNGTINLKTGELQEHKKEDLLSTIIPINYNPNAKCELWLKFLDKVTGSRPELISYLQRAVGYSLTGDTSEQCLFFLYGLGKNGKSTFVGILRKLLGPYGHKTSTDTFLTKDRGGGIKEDLANLLGKRLGVASEIEDGKRLAVVLIKEMTGGESISADRKYEHQFEFMPTHKIWLSGNHKPVITDTTYSIWRRFKLIPFTTTIPDNECDTNLPQKLELELPGILSWAVESCLEWLKIGLGTPKEVVEATETYRTEQDVLGEFIDDCCILKSTAIVPKNDLMKAYTEWCATNNQTPINQRSFKGKIMERGILDGRKNTARIWKGITLKEKPQEQENMLFSDTSDKCDTQSTEKTATLSRVDSLLQNRVTPVTPVTDILYPDFPCFECGSSPEAWLLNENNDYVCPNGHKAFKDDV